MDISLKRCIQLLVMSTLILYTAMKVLDAANKLRDGKIGTLFRTINAATVEESTHYTVMSKICGSFY